jgi:hypothetical protein
VIDHTLPYADIRKDLQAYANSSTPSEGVDPKNMRIFTKGAGWYSVSIRYMPKSATPGRM